MQALPLLADLVGGTRPDLAAKATYLAALIPGDGQAEALALAAHSSEPTVRLASATSLEALPDHVAIELASHLLQDADVGVRHHAAKHATRVASHPAVRAALDRMARDDPNPTLREVVVEKYHVEP